MARTGRDTGNGEASGFDLLREELGRYLGAQVENLAERAGDKLTGVTDQLFDIADTGGALPRILQGESPVKALVSAKAKDVKDNLVEKAKETFGGGGGRKSGTPKVTNIVEVLDVGVPVRFAYDHWTQYERFSSFTKGVRSVSKNDEGTSDWKVKVGPSTRGWKATVQEQVPDERIVWTSEGGKGSTRGCVSFHELTADLTRIVLVVEYYPSGFFEKTGNLWRAQGRRLRLDFKHFQRYVSLTDEEPEGWRGEIRDGEVVRTHEEAMEEEEAEEAEEQETGRGDEEAEGEEEEGEEWEEEEAPEDEESWAEDESEGEGDRYEDEEEYEEDGEYAREA
ncbi:SRPBCC family protein [Streptomyces sp. SAJ15]|uniref:SRPBCC family protein n=1 Tax=Streptomyces sp. SAJ15 TaxID=2011095 RepID=UPI0011865C2B|nr:SRPBCC family protein [Streptomyces sp. SAJ15]TVL89298.1 polyketide cyclase [Streptomyces sp. SAJ15]